MTDLDLSAPNVTAQIRRIVALLDSAPHLFLDLPWFVHRHLGIIASEIMPNPKAAEIEERCMRSLGHQPTKKRKIELIRVWLEEETIDADQAVFFCLTCGIDPREMG